MSTIIEEMERLIKEGYSEEYIDAYCYGKWFTHYEILSESEHHIYSRAADKHQYSTKDICYLYEVVSKTLKEVEL